MKQLDLQELLRYGISGGVFVLVLALLHPSFVCEMIGANTFGEAAILLGVALGIGSIIYALHRAIAYRFFFVFAIFVLSLCRVYPWDFRNFLPLVPSPEELRLDTWRLWLRQRRDPVYPFTNEWGAQVHLLYCTVWAVLLGRVVGHALPGCKATPPGWFYLGACLL